MMTNLVNILEAVLMVVLLWDDAEEVCKIGFDRIVHD